MQLPDVVDLIRRALAEHAWDLAGVLVGTATAVLIGLEYRESRRSRERALVLEVLSDVVLPLLNRVGELAKESHPGYAVRVDADRYTAGAVAGRELAERYLNKLLGRIGRRGFYAKLGKLNTIQEELQRNFEELRRALTDILTNDPRVQSAYGARVNKEDYPTLEHFVRRLVEDFYYCYSKRESSAWDWIHQGSCLDYAPKLGETLKNIDDLLNQRRRTAQQLQSMLEKVVNKAMERYGIPPSELRARSFELR
ncbi:MAG: hypothetical protein LM564_06610 [Desulfurococcaceae archaeon]|nr:hypothetical protein [Desulfurococcaceae archaeon]